MVWPSRTRLTISLYFFGMPGIAIVDAVVRVLLITERTVLAHSMPVPGEEEGYEPTPDTYLLHQPHKVLGYCTLVLSCAAPGRRHLTHIAYARAASGNDRVYTDEDLEKIREHPPALARRPPTFFAIMFNRNVLVTNVIVALGASALTVLEPTLPAVLDGTIDASSPSSPGCVR